MLKEFWEYISFYMSKEELVLAFIGLLFIIQIWIAGGKYEKEQKGSKGMEKINRKVDELGRVTIPLEFRKKLGIENNNTLTMYVDTNRIILKKGIEINELGMVTIPKEVREVLKIKEKEELTVEVADDCILLNKSTN